MRSIIIVFSLIISTVGWGGGVLLAQTASVLTPADESVGVSRSLSTITVDLSHTVDRSSVLQHRRSYGYDTAVFVSLLDSLNISYADTLPGIYVVPSTMIERDTGDVGIFRTASIKGYTTIVDDTTLTFSIDSGQLRFNTEYTIVVDDARCLVWNGSSYDTLTISREVTTFEIEAAPHEIVSVDYGFTRGLIRCGDTIQISYSRKIPSLSNSSGDLIYLLRPSGFINIDSARGYQTYDTLYVAPFLSADSLTVNILTDSIVDGSPYLIMSNHRIFTGNSGDTTMLPVSRYGYGALNVRIVGIDTNVVIPDGFHDFYGAPTRVVMPGDTIVVSVPQFIDHYYFSHWECDGDPSIGAITTTAFTKIYNCSTIVRLNVRAVYRIVAKDTIDLTISGSSWGTVKIEGFADSLGGGVYTVWRMPNESLLLTANANINRQFCGWSATSLPAINGVETPTVLYIPLGNWASSGLRYQIGASFCEYVNPVTCPPYSIELYVGGYSINWRAPRVKVQPTSVANSIGIGITPTGLYSASGTYTSNDPIIDYEIGLDVTNTCYEIKFVKENGRIIAGTDGVEGTAVGATWSKLVSVTGQPCLKRYDIELRHKTYKLTLEMEGISGTLIDLGPMNILRSGPGVESWRGSPTSSRIGWRPQMIVTRFDYWDNLIEYACNEVVTLTPYLDKTGGRYGGYEIVGWYTGAGYTYGAVIDAPKKIIQFTMNQDRIAKLLFDAEDFFAVNLKVRTRAPEKGIQLGGPAIYSFTIITDDSKPQLLGRLADVEAWSLAQIEFEGAGSNETVVPIVEFNKPVDITSLDASSGNQGLWAEDQERADHNDNRMYYTTLADNPASIRIKCTAADGLNAWSSGRLTIHWRGGIRSQEDETLANPWYETIAIAPPLVTIRINSLEVKDDCGWDIPCWVFFAEDDPEVLVITSTGIASLAMDGTPYSEAGVPDSDGPYDGMGQGEDQNISKIVGRQPGFSPLSSNSKASILLSFQVFDLDPQFPNLAAYLTSISQGLTDISVESEKDVKVYIETGLGILSALLADLLIEGSAPDFMADLTPSDPLTFGNDIFGGLPPNANSNRSKSQSYASENGYFRVRYSILLEPR